MSSENHYNASSQTSASLQLEQVSPPPHPRHPEASSIILQQTQSQERTSVAASSVHMCPLQPHGPGHANLHFEPRPWFPLRKAVCVLYAGPLSATRVSVCSFVPSRVIQGHWWLVITSKPSTAAPARRLVCYPGSPIGLLSCFSAAWWGGLGHPSTCHTLCLVLIPRLTPNLCPPTLMGTPYPPLPSWIPAVTQPPGHQSEEPRATPRTEGGKQCWSSKTQAASTVM